MEFESLGGGEVRESGVLHLLGLNIEVTFTLLGLYAQFRYLFNLLVY